MNTIYIEEKSLRKFSKIKDDINTESTLYKNKDTLYKILIPTKRKIEREENIEHLSDLSHKNCVFPKDLVYSDETNSFIGLTMDYLADYQTVFYALNKNKIDFDKGKSFSYQLCDTNDYLEKNGFLYFDYHSHNAMVKDDSIKLIDMDGAKFRFGDDSHLYTLIGDSTVNKNLSQLCFLLLYGEYLSFINVPEYKAQELIKMANRKQKRFLRQVFLYEDNIVDIAECLDHFDKEFMEESKLILRK